MSHAVHPGRRPPRHLCVFALVVACAVLAPASACVSTRPLEGAELRTLAERPYDAAPDMVFDATWLTLERLGYRVDESDRVAGTLKARHADGRGYDVEIAARSARQRVVALPTQSVTHTAQLDAWDELERGTDQLLRAWREPPEWTYDARRNVLEAPGVSFSPPRDFEVVDFNVSRKRVTVQATRARKGGFNPTLMAEIDRRRPEPRSVGLAKETAGLALTARQRLTFPDEWEAKDDQHGMHATVRVLDGTVPLEVRLHAWAATLDAWDVRVTMACPVGKTGPPCDALWFAVVRSFVAPGGRRAAAW